MTRTVCEHCEGRGWTDWIQSAAKFVAPAAKFALRSFGGPMGGAAATGMEALGYGRRVKRTRRVSESSRRRNEIVRRVMREEGVSMPVASRIVKENGLWHRDG
jgi:hypothetical protein